MRSRSAANQVKFTPYILAAIISVLGVANANAVPVTYTETAIITGSLGSTVFTDKLLTVTGTGDTTNVTTLFGVFINPVTASFVIAGVGSGTFTNAIRVFDDKDTTPNFAVAGFTQVGLSGDDALVLATQTAAFFTYNLSTSIGPITGGARVPPVAVFTSAGQLLFDEVPEASTFTAVVTPLPAALPLFATGLGALGLLGWRRKRKANPSFA